MNHPNFTILMVDNVPESTAFYADLLDVTAVEASETFSLFILEGGLKLGLWSRHTAQPAVTAKGGSVELGFQLKQNDDVDACHAAWQKKGLTILQQPTVMDFGYTFTAADPDSHRLRVYAFAG